MASIKAILTAGGRLAQAKNSFAKSSRQENGGRRIDLCIILLPAFFCLWFYGAGFRLRLNWLPLETFEKLTSIVAELGLVGTALPCLVGKRMGQENGQEN